MKNDVIPGSKYYLSKISAPGLDITGNELLQMYGLSDIPFTTEEDTYSDGRLLYRTGNYKLVINLNGITVGCKSKNIEIDFSTRIYDTEAVYDAEIILGYPIRGIYFNKKM